MSEAPTRKDAVRNRERLLQAARDLAATEGLDISLKDVAQAAGVGVGTVYRHFPDKDALVAALFTDQLDAQVARARGAAEQGDAWEALVDYLRQTMRLQAENRGLRALLCPSGSQVASVQECRSTVDPLLERVVELAHEQGTLRADCTARDVILLQVALAGIMDATLDDPTAHERHLDFFLDGVHT